MRIIRKGSAKEEGQTLVEFALVLPILLMLVVAVIDFGWVFMAKLTITNAAREAVRYYSVNKATSAEVEGVAQDTLGAIAGNSPVVFVDDEDPATKNRMAYVRITATVEPLIGFVYSEAINISSQAFMRFEYD